MWEDEDWDYWEAEDDAGEPWDDEPSPPMCPECGYPIFDDACACTDWGALAEELRQEESEDEDFDVDDLDGD